MNTTICHAALKQRIQIGPAISSVSRATLTRNESYTAPLGIIADYAIFLSEKLSLSGQFNFSLDGVENGIFILGGGGNANFYLMGGPNESLADNYISINSSAQLNVFTSIGITAQTYNFSAYDRAAAESGVVIVPDQKDKRQGSFFGLNIGFTADYPISEAFAPGIKFEYKTSFSDNTTPDISIINIGILGIFTI